MLPFSKKFRKIWTTVIIAGYVAFGMLFLQIPDQKFHIYFLDIGQGDSILIKTPENHQILIDGGPGNTVIEELGEVLPFFDKSIDLVVLTHPHADHVDGLIEVLKRFNVNNVLITGVSYDSPDYKEFLNEIEKKNINVLVAESRTDFRFGNVLFDIIYPKNSIAGKKFPNVNNSSITMRVLYKNKKILLTGDLESEAEQKLIQTGVNLKADIFKAGHHGSKTASSMDLLRKVNPTFTVIQSGAGNSFGHPHKETLENFKKIGVKKVFRNDLQGRIEFIF
ncbi:MAG: ComEC/Rec2 family competence protein [Patescibacteria group bacterium]